MVARWLSVLLAGFAFLGSSVCRSASVSVDVDGCTSALEANDFTLNAIVPDADGCTVRWTTMQDPNKKRGKIVLYFGQPGEVTELASEPIVFSRAPDGAFRASRHFAPAELGSQAFVTVLVRSRNEIFWWTPWTVRASPLPPEPPVTSHQSLDLRLGAIHAENSRGKFPSSRQAEGTVWQPADQEDQEYDPDGAYTGSPGIHVSVSGAWTPGDLATTSLKDALRRFIDEATGVQTREVRFGDLAWTESMPDAVRYEDATELFERRHYYSIVTIWTDASIRPIGKGEIRRFVHETSASPWTPDDVTEWASYSRATYTSDPRLLELIDRTVRKGRSIPGFDHTPDTRAGDGGPSVFSLRLIARLRPWAVAGDAANSDPRFRAGIESFAVVGSRTGLGTSELVADAEGQSALCNALGVHCAEKNTATAELPPGWYREPGGAHLTNAEGNIPILQVPPQIAQSYASRASDVMPILEEQYRGVLGKPRLERQGDLIVLQGDGGNAIRIERSVPMLRLSELPTNAYFVLGAKLQAGALVRKTGQFWSRKYRIIPINAYAQYVVRTSVIKDAASVLTGAPTREIQKPSELGKDIAPPPAPGWIERILQEFTELPALFRIAIVAAAIVVLLWVITPLRPVLTALGRLIAVVLDFISNLLRRFTLRK